ncbi:hypothetical protein P691DRAFT_737054 [Macrolepiota fuliginosa MF-IS2]|uniref:DUF6534 domain-containing protein n=1 Tax=Macrolepiota fuliginosa MF-IS2 TaxID=1400762 RepID=A0A9P5X779_9AGAR|nr:hypothetical protein P691DRAFT_737054 [Macrolepiota fuliginosa MF-IS2]
MKNRGSGELSTRLHSHCQRHLHHNQFLGIFLNGYFFGLLTLQYYHYNINFSNDLRWLRNIVHLQFFLETVQTVMSAADGFHWFVFGYGDTRKLGEYFLANFDAPMMYSIIALISQGVYCWRIYHLSGWKVPTLIIALTACTQAAGGIGVGIINQQLGTIENWRPKSNVFMILWLVCSAIADTLIACLMTYLLLSSKSLTSGSKRPAVVTRLIRLIIETNVASALVAMAVLLCAVIPPIAPPKTSFFMCPGYVLGKLYSNSFIAMLNNRSRQAAGSGASGALNNSINGESILMHQQPSWGTPSSQSKHANTPSVIIDVHMETAVRFDDWERPLPQH